MHTLSSFFSSRNRWRILTKIVSTFSNRIGLYGNGNKVIELFLNNFTMFLYGKIERLSRNLTNHGQDSRVKMFFRWGLWMYCQICLKLERLQYLKFTYYSSVTPLKRSASFANFGAKIGQLPIQSTIKVPCWTKDKRDSISYIYFLFLYINVIVSI